MRHGNGRVPYSTNVCTDGVLDTHDEVPVGYWTHLFVEGDVTPGGAAVVHLLLVVIVKVVVVFVGIVLVALVLAVFAFPVGAFLERVKGRGLEIRSHHIYHIASEKSEPAAERVEILFLLLAIFLEIVERPIRPRGLLA